MPLIHCRDGATWERVAIPPEGLAVCRAGGAVALTLGRHPEAAAHVVPLTGDAPGAAALVVGPRAIDLTVGGRHPLEVAVLEERDEIVLGEARLYFSAREPLAVSRLEGEGSCGVCGDPARGCQVVACSGCGAVTHEGLLAGGGERRCFAHRGACPSCGLAPADFAWVPDDA